MPASVGTYARTSTFRLPRSPLRITSAAQIELFAAAALSVVVALTHCPRLAAHALADGRAELLERPTEYTDVADGLVGHGIDVRLALSYASYVETGSLTRERLSSQGRTQRVALAEAESAQKYMWMLAEVGVYRDLMAFVRVPFLLQDRRALVALSDAAEDSAGLGIGDGSAGLISPVRYGVPLVNVGAAYGPLNQFRNPGWPTVVLRLSTQWATGKAMKPCLRSADCSRVASRGTWAMEAETRFSYRYRYLEPYAGFAWGREFVAAAGERNYRPAGRLTGDLYSDPPAYLRWTAGLAVIPWEARHRFQRLTVDTRLSAQWVSRGRQYSPLFDVLGSSGDRRLSTVQAGLWGDGSGAAAPFTGMTTVDGHALLSGELSLRIQAARYVRFQLALGLTFQTPHAITGASPCSSGAVDVVEGAVMCTSGRENPSFRALIDSPGQRFFLSEIVGVGTTLSAAAEF